MTMSKVLIVLGMHRSGTSLVSGWLHQCQLNLGSRHARPGMANSRGFFEDLDFLDTHQEMLSYFNIDNRGLIPPFNFELTDHQYSQLQKLLAAKSSNCDQWGWKEPRTCLFIKYYNKLIPDAKYLILYRDYAFVVESLIRRDIEGLKSKYERLSLNEQILQMNSFEEQGKRILSTINTYLSTWIIYNQHLLDLMLSNNKESYIALRYTDLIDNDENIFNRLISWGFKLTYSPFSSFFSSYLINEELPEITFDPILEEEAIVIKNKFDDYILKNKAQFVSR